MRLKTYYIRNCNKMLCGRRPEPFSLCVGKRKALFVAQWRLCLA